MFATVRRYEGVTNPSEAGRLDQCIPVFVLTELDFGLCLPPWGEAMKRVMKSFLLAVALLTVVGAPSAHAEPCGGRGYPQDNGGSRP